MGKNSLCGGIGIGIPPEGKDILDAVILKLAAESIYFLFVIAEAGQMGNRLGMELLADLLADGDGLVVIGASAGAEGDADIVGF